MSEFAKVGANEHEMIVRIKEAQQEAKRFISRCNEAVFALETGARRPFLLRRIRCREALQLGPDSGAVVHAERREKGMTHTPGPLYK